MPESSDPYTYTYPATDVLRNLLDIRDPLQLAAFEANATAARLFELHAAPLAGRFDIAHLRAMHGHIIQDVYSWAGEFRTVNILKGGHLFGVVGFIEPGEINAVHPFRDGNGRAQREFIRELAVQAGFVIDWTRVSRDEMMAASLESFQTGDCSRMAALIRASMQ